MSRQGVLAKTAVCCLWMVLLMTVSVFPVAAKTKTNLLTAEEIADIRSARSWPDVNVASVLALADRWMNYTPQELRDKVPPASVPRAFDTHFLQCPQHSEEIKAFGSYPWIIDPDQPYKLICPVGGEVYPTNDFDHHHPGGPEDVSSEPYVDTGWGWKDPNHPQKYWFVAYYAHWLYHNHLRPAAVALGQAYVITGDARYATQGAALLDRIAEEYPDMDHVKQSRYGTEIQVGTYQGRILNCIWETSMARDLATAYDYLYEGLQGNQALEEATGKSIADIKENIEKNLLESAAQSIYTMDGRIRGNFGMHHSALATLAIVLDNENTDRYLDFVLYATGMGSYPYEGIIMGLSNLIYRDGAPFESSPGYNSLWIGQFNMVAELFLRRGINLYQDYPKLKRLFDYPLRIVMAEKFSPNIGDEGSVKARGITGWRSSTYKTAFEQWGDRTYLTGTPQTTASDNMSAYGLAMLRSGKGSQSAGLSLYYGPAGGHGHYDRLNIELFAKDERLLPDLGYPEYMSGFHKKLAGWTAHTVSHNTVLVNERRQLNKNGGRLQLFSGSPQVQYVDVRAEEAYEGITSRYQRSVAMINPTPAEVYAVDVFRVEGGYQHDYSIHGPDGEFSVQGLELTPPRTEGTLAGPDVPFGYLYDAPQLERPGYTGAYGSYQGSGFSYLRTVQAGAPEGLWHADWALGSRKGIRVSFVPEAGTEVLVADGEPPQNKAGNPPALKYVLARRKADGANLDSTFVTVLQPFEGAPFMEDIRRMEPADGDHGTVVALQMKHAYGEDLVFQSVSEGDTFVGIDGARFQGLLGVLSRTPGGMVNHAQLLGGGTLQDGDFLLETAPSYTGGVLSVDYTAGSFIVELDDEVPAMPQGLSLDGQRIVISNERHATEFLVNRVEALTDRQYKITLQEPMDLTGQGRVISVAPQAIGTDTPLPLANHYVGQQVVNPTSGQAVRIDSVSGGNLRLHKGEHGLRPGMMFHIYDFGAGDRFRIASAARLHRTEGDGLYEVSSNTTGRLILWDGREWRLEPGTFELRVPTVAVEVVSPLYDEQVSGVVQPEVKLQIPPELELSHIEIGFAGQSVYSASRLPSRDELSFDSTAVEDGQATLRIAVTDSLGKTVVKTMPLRVQNWWDFVADFWEPTAGGWFGDIDFNEIYDRSAGWTFVKDDAEAFHDDPHRMTRVGSTEEYLVWESPALHSFEVIVYAKEAFAIEDIEFAVSGDGVRWEAIPYRRHEGPVSEAGWQRFELSGEQIPDANTGFIRVLIKAGAPDMQLGRISLRGQHL